MGGTGGLLYESFYGQGFSDPEWARQICKINAFKRFGMSLEGVEHNMRKFWKPHSFSQTIKLSMYNGAVYCLSALKMSILLMDGMSEPDIYYICVLHCEL